MQIVTNIRFKDAFDAKCQKCFCVTLDKSNRTPGNPASHKKGGSVKRTISAMRGKGSLTHNRRDFIAENVDSSRTPLNVEYRNEDIRTVYTNYTKQSHVQLRAYTIRFRFLRLRVGPAIHRKVLQQK